MGAAVPSITGERELPGSGHGRAEGGLLCEIIRRGLSPAFGGEFNLEKQLCWIRR